MGFKLNEDGQVVQVLEQPVDEAAIEAELQAELDAAQSEANTHATNVANAEGTYEQAEAAANAAADELENHKKLLEGAQERIQKSQAEHASFQAARELRDAGTGDEAPADADSDTGESEDDTEPVSETVELPVNVVTAEG